MASIKLVVGVIICRVHDGHYQSSSDQYASSGDAGLGALGLLRQLGVYIDKHRTASNPELLLFLTKKVLFANPPPWAGWRVNWASTRSATMLTVQGSVAFADLSIRFPRIPE